MTQCMLRTTVALALITGTAGCGSGLPVPQFERFDPRITPGRQALPDAPAVVLLDRGTLVFAADGKTGNPIARLRRYRRIKILRESGLNQARIQVTHDPLAAVHGLKAQAVGINGRTLTPRRDARHVANAAGGGTWHLAIEGVPVGAVVETTYDLYLSDPRFIRPWFFAGPLPTERSEYAVVVPPGFSIDLRFTENGVFVDRPPERFETDHGVRFSWSRSKLDPLYPEESMPNPARIAPAAHVIYTSATIRGRTYPGFPSWDAVGRWFLLRRPDYGELSDATRKEAHRIATDAPPVEKGLKLMGILARNLPNEAPTPDPLWRARLPHPDHVLKERRGNPTSRGLLLVALLRSAGVAAVPALFTYRDSGVLAPDAPMVTMLDGVAAAIFDRDRLVVLDPSQLTVSADVPSPRLMGTRLVLLREEQAEIRRVPVSQPEQSVTRIRYDVRLDPRGELYGPLEATLTGAEAGALRTNLFHVEPEAYAEIVSTFMKSRGVPLAIESVNLSDLKALRRPLKVEGSIRVPLVLDPEAELLSIRVGEFVGTNAITPREVRRSPLILEAPSIHEVQGTLTLPEEWEHTNLPEAAEAGWEGGTLQLTLRKETRRRLGFVRRVVCHHLEVAPSEYRAYRRFVEEGAVQEDQTVAVKRPPPSALAY